MATPEFLQYFPKLVAGDFAITSEKDPTYNCIAWALGDTTNWWWPDEDGYWPAEVPREWTIAAFIAAFALHGYEVCPAGDHETGFEKIAIYAADSIPLHAARQLPNGCWTSKLGPLEDIEHNHAVGLTSDIYGKVSVWMKKRII